MSLSKGDYKVEFGPHDVEVIDTIYALEVLPEEKDKLYFEGKVEKVTSIQLVD